MAARPTRENRGTNMSALIADVVQQGDNFWSNEDWKQDEGDDENDDSSFEDVDAKPDMFDSDFNDTEDSGSEEDASDAEAEKPNRVANKYKEPAKKTQGYKEPVYRAPKPKPAPGEQTKKRKRPEVTFSGEVGSVSSRMRQSTKSKTREADVQRKKATLVGNFKGRTKLNVKQEFTQRQLLEEALDTEKVNAKWITLQKLAEEDSGRVERPTKEQDKQAIRYISRRGMYPTVSFMNFDSFPPLFDQTTPIPWVKVNPDYGKYKDPVTGKFFNTVEEFKQLRSKQRTQPSRKN